MKKICSACLGSVFFLLTGTGALQAADPTGEPADFLPADTLTYVTVGNFNDVIQATLDLPLVKAVSGPDSDKTFQGLGMTPDDMAELRGVQKVMNEVFTSSEAKQLFGSECGLAFVKHGDLTGDEEYNFASHFAVILGGGSTAVLDSYLNMFTDDLGEIEMSDVIVDGVTLRRYADPALVDDNFALPEPGALEPGAPPVEPAPAPSTEPAPATPTAPAVASDEPAEKTVDSVYAGVAHGRLVAGTSPEVVAALVKGGGASLSGGNTEFARYRPMWGAATPAELRGRVFVDVDGIVAFLGETFPDVPEIQEIKKSYQGLHSIGGASIVGKNEIHSSYRARVTESQLQSSMRFSGFEKKFSLLRPGNQTIFLWTRILDGAKMLATVQESVMAAELKQVDAEAFEEFGMSVSDMFKAFGPQLVFGLGKPAAGSALPIPDVQIEVETKDRKVVHKLVESLVNLSIQDYGEESRPNVVVGDDKVMTLNWPSMEATGMFPLFRITADSVQFSFSGSAVAPKFNQAPLLEVDDGMLEMAMVDMGQVADLLTTAYTWGRMMIPPETDPSLLTAITDTIDWVRTFGTMKMTFAQEGQDALVFQSVLTRVPAPAKALAPAPVPAEAK